MAVRALTEEPGQPGPPQPRNSTAAALARTARRQATKKGATFLASNPAALAVVALVVVLMLIVLVAAGGALVQAGQLAPPEPAEVALRDIPEEYLELYQVSADDFHVPWAVLAGIGKVASDHGRRSPYDSIRRGSGPDSSLFPEVKPPIGEDGSPALGPMLIRPAGYKDIRHFNPQRVRHSADWVAERLEKRGDAVAEKIPVDRDQLELDLAEEEEGAEELWIRLWTAAVNGLPLGSASGCSAPGGSTGDRILSVWRCVLADKTLHVATADGELTGADAVNLLTQEAVEVAWLFSRWGEVPCDPAAADAGVFPLPQSSPVDRCDPEANIAEAARLVAAGEEIPLGQRPAVGGPGSPAQGGWRGLPLALGPGTGQQFAQTGFPKRVSATEQCRRAVASAVQALPRDGDTSGPRPFAGFTREALRDGFDTAWSTEPLGTLRTDSRCGPAAEDTQWRRFVLGQMGRVFGVAGTSLDPGGNSAGIMGYLEATTGLIPAEVGRTSLVQRLSNPEVSVSSPSPSGRAADFADPAGLGAEAIRWAKAYLGIAPPPVTESGSAAPCSGGAVPASADIDPGALEAINKLRPVYEEVAGQKALPWPLLAAIDYRENNNNPDRSTLSGEPIGTPNPDNPGRTTTSKKQSVELAADHVKAMASSVYGVTLTATSTEDDVKNALLAYNRGYIYKSAGASADQSPYVMNQWDEAHRDMTWPGISGEPLAGRTEYGRYGGWTLFARLGGASAAGCGTLSDSDIVAIAQKQLGHKEDPKGSNRGPEIEPYLGSAASYGEPWCADFLSWVYREAGQPFTGGVDGGWRLPGVLGVHGWLEKNGIWHYRGDADTPQPGDVVTFRDDDHTGLVERVDGTTLHTIEGNSSDMVTRRTYPSYNEGSEVLGWGRMKAAA